MEINPYKPIDRQDIDEVEDTDELYCSKCGSETELEIAPNGESYEYCKSCNQVINF